MRGNSLPFCAFVHVDEIDALWVDEMNRNSAFFLCPVLCIVEHR